LSFGHRSNVVSIKTQSSDALVPDGWTATLADAVAPSLREFAPQLRGTTVVLLQVICLPWHGLLSLAILTAEELVEDASLEDPMRTMEWRHGEFTEEVETWGLTTPLAQQMRAAYTTSSDCPATAVVFLRACARAMATAGVAEAVSLLDRADGFRISAPHPDDRREFFLPETGPGAAPDRRRTE
jgi:hypothetical protein